MGEGGGRGGELKTMPNYKLIIEGADGEEEVVL
jgi:hypothetical protein